MVSEKRFTTVVTTDRKRRVVVPVPFDPNEVWGAKTDHRVGGTVNDKRVRGTVEPLEDGYGLALGPAWRRDCGIAAGDKVKVVLTPEGPQRGDLATDVGAALAASPAAGAFFDGLAQFYRKAYLAWVDGTKRRPDVRAARIAELVEYLEAGRKERPKG
jgi:bifunctional DNA-binding transcriptional regulator/antitoxin component of YhaV-PrlF toxin-antitoxin module